MGLEAKVLLDKVGRIHLKGMGVTVVSHPSSLSAWAGHGSGLRQSRGQWKGRACTTQCAGVHLSSVSFCNHSRTHQGVSGAH